MKVPLLPQDGMLTQRQGTTFTREASFWSGKMDGSPQAAAAAEKSEWEPVGGGSCAWLTAMRR